MTTLGPKMQKNRHDAPILHPVRHVWTKSDLAIIIILYLGTVINIGNKHNRTYTHEHIYGRRGFHCPTRRQQPKDQYGYSILSLENTDEYLLPNGLQQR
jgi:hypothetical protein